MGMALDQSHILQRGCTYIATGLDRPGEHGNDVDGIYH